MFKLRLFPIEGQVYTKIFGAYKGFKGVVKYHENSSSYMLIGENSVLCNCSGF